MIGVITYNIPHRKTQDLMWRLILKGYDLTLLIIPFKQRDKSRVIYNHRPTNTFDSSPLNYDLPRIICNDYNDIALYINDFEKILIAGAELLPDKVTKKGNIINSHPGYLPNVKGLDALKWAIYNEQPIGVTTHTINDKTDSGLLIDRQIIPVYYEDTFHSLAYRVYEKEIEMLVHAIELPPISDPIMKDVLINDNYKPNMRMPWYLERIMIDRFENLRKISPSQWGENE